jgi:uncharacterized protein with GYD domain
MPKFLWRGSYSIDGAKGLIEDGATKRRADAEKALASVGGKLEALYWAFGEDDVYGIVDFPDNVTAGAVSLATAAAGVVRVKTVVLMTAEEVDEATRKSHDYRAPGTSES